LKYGHGCDERSADQALSRALFLAGREMRGARVPRPTLGDRVGRVALA
jgi:hypothetical protein